MFVIARGRIVAVLAWSGHTCFSVNRQLLGFFESCSGQSTFRVGLQSPGNAPNQVGLVAAPALLVEDLLVALD